MNIWLITTGEPVPISGKSPHRLMRTGYFSAFLANAGHNVVWWASAFSHAEKQFLDIPGDVLHIRGNMEIRLLRGCGYKNNVSLARIRDHKQVAANFWELARQSQKPDLILCSYPTIELSAAAVRYGKEFKVPVMLDIRDMWPDVFLELVPFLFRPLLRFLISPYYRKAIDAIKGAKAVTGVTDEYISWALNLAARERAESDVCVPLGYERHVLNAHDFAAAKQELKQKGVLDYSGMTLCFFGTLGRQFEIDVVIAAAKILKSKGYPVRFVICGGGDRAEYYKRKAAGVSNFILPGRVNAAEISVLMAQSAAGLAPYRESKNFYWNIPNKIGEYLSGGLPIILGLKEGVAKSLLSENDCCVEYNGSAETLAEKIAELHDSPAVLERLRKNAVKLFESSFRAERIYSDFASHLTRIAKHAM
ncbi:MAG: hypothetical protein CVU79_00245 [Elusimicrobia bacterium HGW-Elusimicrobia-3]|jgi:glycosyltransferase involved in cell wall biosynthesis|nr:MAG: hypothetical protein CVU79_00245 [Elusimicrobia bacterium HGW-Elusimicrobia-3]